MSKALLYRLFGFGTIPAAQATELEREGVILQDEGLKASQTWVNFRAPGRFSAWKRQWFVGSLTLTWSRLLGLRGSRAVIDVPLTDSRLREMQFSVESAEILLVALDASLFQRTGPGHWNFASVHPWQRRLSAS